MSSLMGILLKSVNIFKQKCTVVDIYQTCSLEWTYLSTLSFNCGFLTHQKLPLFFAALYRWRILLIKVILQLFHDFHINLFGSCLSYKFLNMKDVSSFSNFIGKYRLELTLRHNEPFKFTSNNFDRIINSLGNVGKVSHNSTGRNKMLTNFLWNAVTRSLPGIT